MHYLITLLMISTMAFGLACQSASSSSTETKNDKPANAAKEKAEKKDEKPKADDGHGHDKDGEAKRISLADAKKDFDAGNVVIIDTRSENAYKNEHIKGALNVPAGDFEKAYKKVPKDKKIIAYCS